MLNHKLLVLSLIVAASAARAEEAIFQASLTPEAAIHSKEVQINGFALNLWGQNPQSAFALGLVNGSTGESRGFTWSFYNYADSYTGVAWGLANYSTTSFVGWQGGIFFLPCLVNISRGSCTGFQEGLVNVSEKFTGLQLGIVNYAANLHGVQIGLVNIAMNNAWFDRFPDELAKGFPIVNWSF